MRDYSKRISQCNHENSVFKPWLEDAVAECQDCGAHQIELPSGEPEWVGKCRTCHQEVDKLYGLFVPHLCLECYNRQRADEIRRGWVCPGCRQPYIDCCC